MLSLPVAWVQSLVGELRSCKPRSVAKKPHLPVISKVVFLLPGTDQVAALLRSHRSRLALKAIPAIPTSRLRLLRPRAAGIWHLLDLDRSGSSAPLLTHRLECHFLSLPLVKILLIPQRPGQVSPPPGNIFI